MNNKKLLPMFKWTGGKRKEIKNFESYFPDFIKNNQKYTFVEPFVGGGAVLFYLNNVDGKNIINDFDKSVSNFYKQISLKNKNVINTIKSISKISDHDELEKKYYHYRDMDKNGGLKSLSDEELAIRFFVVNQLAFSGMRRFNSSGEFNVPFGHYKSLSAKVLDNNAYFKLLEHATIQNLDFEKVIKENDKENTFIFVDPPYTRVFKKYSANNTFGDDDHLRLKKVFCSLDNACAMIIIDKSDFTSELYKDYIKSSYTVKYGVNIKNRFNQNSEHLIICNY